MIVERVIGYQVLDSRGKPTVAAHISLSDGSTHTARVPSGASTGKHEAKELRDLGSAFAERFYAGLSVHQAVSNINSTIAPRLVGQSIDLEAIDRLLTELDPSENHSQLGANATLAVSLASALASAHSKNTSLARFFQPDGALAIPMPMINILSGGAHANRTMDIQDVLIIPIGAKSFTESMSWIVAVREMASKLGREDGKVTHLVADEGGLGIAFDSIEHACEFVMRCVEQVGLTVGKDISLALDVASTQFFDGKNYNLATINKSYTPTEFVTYMHLLVSQLPIISIEDPFAEDDWTSWEMFQSMAPKQLQLLGDDLLTTNMNRLDRAISGKNANAILIKANQNGLVTSTRDVLRKAQENNFRTVVSGRSGDTEDSWLSDLATGWRAGQIKAGSTHNSERNSKWNRLMELEAVEETVFANPFI